MQLLTYMRRNAWLFQMMDEEATKRYLRVSDVGLQQEQAEVPPTVHVTQNIHLLKPHTWSHVAYNFIFPSISALTW